MIISRDRQSYFPISIRIFYGIAEVINDHLDEPVTVGNNQEISISIYHKIKRRL